MLLEAINKQNPDQKLHTYTALRTRKIKVKSKGKQVKLKGVPTKSAELQTMSIRNFEETPETLHSLCFTLNSNLTFTTYSYFNTFI